MPVSEITPARNTPAPVKVYSRFFNLYPFIPEKTTGSPHSESGGTIPSRDRNRTFPFETALKEPATRLPVAMDTAMHCSEAAPGI